MKYVKGGRDEQSTATRKTEKIINDAGEDIRHYIMERSSKFNKSYSESTFLDVSDSETTRKRSRRSAGVDEMRRGIGALEESENHRTAIEKRRDKREENRFTLECRRFAFDKETQLKRY